MSESPAKNPIGHTEEGGAVGRRTRTDISFDRREFAAVAWANGFVRGMAVSRMFLY